LLPVNGPGSDFGEMFRRRVLHLGGWESRLAILQVKQLDAVSVLSKHLQRIATGLSNPVTVHLHADEFRVAATHHGCKTSCVSETTELIVVIVKSELHAALMNCFAPNVELIGGSLVAVQREPHALGQNRANDILNPERLRVVDFCIKSAVVEVPAGCGQSVVVDHPTQFGRGMPIDIPVGLDLGVANLANGFEDGGKIARRVLAHGVQLRSERTALRGKQSGTSQPAGSRDRQPKKPTSVEHALAPNYCSWTYCWCGDGAPPRGAGQSPATTPAHRTVISCLGSRPAQARS